MISVGVDVAWSAGVPSVEPQPFIAAASTTASAVVVVARAKLIVVVLPSSAPTLLVEPHCRATDWRGRG